MDSHLEEAVLVVSVGFVRHFEAQIMAILLVQHVKFVDDVNFRS